MKMGEHKTVLITGASTGIGKELAKLFAADGYRLILTSRDFDRLNAAADEMKAKYRADVTALQKDLSRDGAADELYGEIKRLGLAPDVLVNNAGVGVCGEFTGYEQARDDEMINLNIRSLTVLTKLAARDMAARGGGKILNVASVGAYQPGPYIAVYYATKAYVLSLSAALRRELAPMCVCVCALCPGPVATEFARRAGREMMKGAMPASTVARCGYRGLMRGRGIIIPGFIYKIGAAASKILPMPIVAFAIERVQKMLSDNFRYKNNTHKE